MSLERSAPTGQPPAATPSQSPAAPTPQGIATPEQVLCEWLRWLSPTVDISEAARAQIAAIDRRGSQHPSIRQLRMLLVALAGGVTRRQTFTHL